MIKFLINIIELAIIAKVSYKVIKFFFVRKKYEKNKKGKSILGKISYIISENIHHHLDQRIKAQIAKRTADITQQSQNNVVDFKKYTKTKSN